MATGNMFGFREIYGKVYKTSGSGLDFGLRVWKSFFLLFVNCKIRNLLRKFKCLLIRRNLFYEKKLMMREKRKRK